MPLVVKVADNRSVRKYWIGRPHHENMAVRSVATVFSVELYIDISQMLLIDQKWQTDVENLPILPLSRMS
jgi:hypothetical protein